MKVKINKLINNTGQIEGLPANPRQIDKTDYERLLKSLKEDPDFLVHKPLHVYEHNDKYVVLGGNQRLRALKELGYKDVPVTVYAADTPPETLRARIMKDNAQYGDWDMDMLANEWSDEPLTDWGVDLPEDWLEQEPEIEEDEAPEVSDEPPVSKLGEVYQLGRHRVMCADSTVKENVELLMNGEKADMVFTDPPYGANMGIEGDDGKKYIDIFDKFYSVMPCDDNIYVCCDWRCIGDFYASIRKRHQVYNLIVWVKNLFGQGKLYHTKHEEIIFCGSGDYNKKNINKDENVWNADSVRNFGGSKNAAEAVGHPTQKPIEICSRAIKNSSERGESVYDGFLGSGSTLIACEQTDRTCYGMELSEAYTDVVRKRYHKFVTGSEDGWEDATAAI